MNKLITITLLFFLVTTLLFTNHQGPIIISDDGSGEWASVTIDSSSGTSHFLSQPDSGGNPGAYLNMEYILPPLQDTQGLTMVSQLYVYLTGYYEFNDSTIIDHIDFSEDIRLLSLPWEDAWLVSFPVISQQSGLYRTNNSLYMYVEGDTTWKHRTLTGLTKDDFINMDGSDDKPNFQFSPGNNEMRFGFWRFMSRTGGNPPIPADQDLIYQHGSDNFTVAIHEEPNSNHPPIATTDEYWGLNPNDTVLLNLLVNDYDPDGDPISIYAIDKDPDHADIIAWNDSYIFMIIDTPFIEDWTYDEFVYILQDSLLQTSGQGKIHYCFCPITCLHSFIEPPPQPPRSKLTKAISKLISLTGIGDSLDVQLFRRFRDEVLLPTEVGTKFRDLYYQFSPEIMTLLIYHRPDLGRKAYKALQLMQIPIRNLLESDGSAIITQELVDSVNVFLDSLIVTSSDSLKNALTSTLALLCPFQNLIGLTIKEALDGVICDTMHTSVDAPLIAQSFILEQNYPNPFTIGGSSQTGKNASTQISYHLPKAMDVKLIIFDIHGQRIVTLVDEYQHEGKITIGWNGCDETGNMMNAGIYIYQFISDSFRETKKMLLVR